MTARTYNNVVRGRPELGLPYWAVLKKRHPHLRGKVRRMTRDQLITLRTARILSGESNVFYNEDEHQDERRP